MELDLYELFTRVVFISHNQALCPRPVDQIEVNVIQVQLWQAVEGSFHGFLTLILWAQFAALQKDKVQLLRGRICALCPKESNMSCTSI